MRFLATVLSAGLWLGVQAAAAANATNSTGAATSVATGGVVLVRGNKLFNAKTGERFFIKGMTYEYAVDDEHYDKYSKDVIAKHLADVEMNTMRLYDINPDLSYKKFMTDMATRGVYVVVGGTPDNSDYYGKYRYATLKKAVGPDDGETCYSPVLLEYGKKIAKNFAAYDNTLAILIGNEVMQKDLTAGACVKQYVADLKTWMRVNAKKIRMIPLAYAAADSAYGSKIPSAEEYHTLKIQGLLCGDKMQDGVMTRSIDIYLINEYRWCPGREFAVYQQFQNMAQGLPIVIGFGEYGCKIDVTRDWAMVPYFYDEPTKTEGFSAIWSGGLAYSFGEAKLPAGSTFPMFKGGSMDPMGQPSNEPTPDFENLKEMFAKHKAFSEKAEWDESSKCKWAPEVSKVSDTNKRASTSGWLVAECSADVLKVVETDTWTTKSRQGLDCESGSDCDVPVKESVGTTQEELCGKTVATNETTTGGACKASRECLNGGECADGKCKCAACYTGTNCGFKDESACPSSSGGAADVTAGPSTSASTVAAPTAIGVVTVSIIMMLSV